MIINPIETSNMNKLCLVQECQHNIHAKGYCRRHYLQIWKHGKIINKTLDKKSSICKKQQLKALQKEYERLLELYEAVIGIDGRLRYKNKINKLLITAKENGCELKSI